MKIAIFHELDFGGAKRVVMEFAKRLKKNHKVDLYYVGENKENIGAYFNNVYYYKFISSVWKGNNWKVRLYKDTIGLIKLYSLHKNIAHDIQLRKYDCIFVHPSKFTQAPFLLRFLKNQCAYYCEEPLRIIYDPAIASNIEKIEFPKNIYEFLNRKIRKWIDSKNFKNANTVLVNSNFSKKIIEKSYERSAEVCYLGVDADFFKPLNISKTIDVLFIGNKDKSYDLLNDALDLFKVNRPNVYTIFRDNKKINVSDKELVELYNKSKVLVALNRNEPFGLIPLEAMACGVLVIALNEGGYKESVIDGKTGFLISRDQNEIYKKINNIISDDKLMQKMGDNARKNVLQNWTWDKSIEKFLEIIKNNNI